MVTTADGRVTIGGRSGPIGNEADQDLFHALRTRVDAVMVGAGTLRAEKYGRLVRKPERREARERAGLAPDPLAVVVSGRLDLPPDLPLLHEPEQQVLVATFSDGELPGPGIEYLRFNGGAVDIPRAPRHPARTRRALRSVRGRPDAERRAAARGSGRRALPLHGPEARGGARCTHDGDGCSARAGGHETGLADGERLTPFRTFFPAITLATGERKQEIRYPSRPMATRPTEVAPRRRQAPKPAAPVVEFKDVTKVYDGGAVGLDRASLRIGRGEFVFLVGATGCGKSTCIRLLLKELEASKGDILIAGRTLSDIPRSKVPYLRRNIGVVFQDYKLLPNRTVYDNVAYSLQVIGESRQEIRRKVPDILRLVGLSTKLHNFPDELSGGEQQRVSIARAFVNHPPLLLADEPTGNLDPETSIGIMQLIYRINRTGTTVIVATHDHSMVDKMRRRVVELQEGRIIRDEVSGLYRPDESTSEFAIRLRGEMGIGAEGHPN